MSVLLHPFVILFYRWPWSADLGLTLLALSPLGGLGGGVSWWILIPWLVIGGVLAYATWWRPRHVVLRHHQRPFFTTPGTTVRIIFFSDLHLGPFKGRRWLAQLARQIKKLAPDVILFGGDFYYSNQLPRYQQLLREFAVIAQLAPTYVIWGNHDIFTDHQTRRADNLLPIFTKYLQATGAHLLDNTAVDLSIRGRSFRLIGVADYLTHPPHTVVSQLYESPLPKIVLTHNPDLVAEYDLPAAELTLAGHTHGGQVCFPFLGPLPSMLPYHHHEYLCGLYPLSKTTLIVTAGAGESWLRLRWWCPPEIRIIDLETRS